MKKYLRALFTLLVAWPVVRLWLGVAVSHRERLPVKGPAIIIANHNSHLDVLTLFSLFSLRALSDVHPVAAADYFLKNKWLAWFSLNVIGIIPVHRGNAQGNPLQSCIDALNNGKIVIIFPEGTRGEPGQLLKFKSGLWHLCQACPQAPVIPVYLHGLDRAMGKGQRIPVPFFIDVYVDEPTFASEEKEAFKARLFERFFQLQEQAKGNKE